MMIPEEYFTKELNVKLTSQEIEFIISELNRVPHDIFEFSDYQKIIDKLQNIKEDYIDFIVGIDLREEKK